MNFLIKVYLIARELLSRVKYYLFKSFKAESRLRSSETRLLITKILFAYKNLYSLLMFQIFQLQLLTKQFYVTNDLMKIYVSQKLHSILSKYFHIQHIFSIHPFCEQMIHFSFKSLNFNF